MNGSFAKNVFVNCPFDDTYRPLLRPLLFTIIDLGLNPRISSESLDSGQPRIQKIVSLISESQFAIHDLSRIQATKKDEYFRLNMPLELGIDFGCKTYGQKAMKKKRCLVLEAERYRFQKAISDLAGSDIAAHENEPEKLVVEVRNWLRQNAKANGSAGAQRIFFRFNKFMAENYQTLKNDGHSRKEINNLPVNELIERMIAWVKGNPVSRKAS